VFLNPETATEDAIIEFPLGLCGSPETYTETLAPNSSISLCIPNDKNSYTVLQGNPIIYMDSCECPVEPIDPDAEAFILAAGIEDPTQQDAIEGLVADLKTYGLWAKMKAVYPFVGGTAFSHKFNLKDPQDLDAAFRLVFSGGSTHSSTGWQPNGINGYADTKLLPSSVLLQNDNSFGFYSRTEVDALYYDMGSFNSPKNSIILARFSGSFYGANSDDGYDTAANSSSLGLLTSSRTGVTTKKGYRNGTEIQSSSRTSTGLPGLSNIWLGGINGIGGWSAREFAFAFISSGLNGTEISDLYTAVQNFNTILGRQVI
jgi:hypothetical protein